MQVASLTAAAALSAVGERLADTSARVAAAVSPEGSGDLLDLSAAMIALMQSKHQAAALTNVIRTAGEIDQQVIDLLA